MKAAEANNMQIVEDYDEPLTNKKLRSKQISKQLSDVPTRIVTNKEINSIEYEDSNYQSKSDVTSPA